MRKRNVFRPAVDPLEDRLTLNGSGMTDPDNIQSGGQFESQIGDQNPALDVPGAASETDGPDGVAQANTVRTAARQSKSNGVSVSKQSVGSVAAAAKASVVKAPKLSVVKAHHLRR